jgi:excinuclease UvrABC nuclease subunit
MRSHFADKIAALPHSPGVYLMRDAKGVVFYIGKAKSLRDRVRSYFSGSDTRPFVSLLDRMLADLEVVLTTNEKEAMLVESELIKEHTPRFNVHLKDDKRFLCIRLDTRERYPRLQVVRRFGKDGARYFGPYHSAHSLREVVRLVNRHFQLRTCNDQVLANRAVHAKKMRVVGIPAHQSAQAVRGERGFCGEGAPQINIAHLRLTHDQTTVGHVELRPVPGVAQVGIGDVQRGLV